MTHKLTKCNGLTAITEVASTHTHTHTHIHILIYARGILSRQLLWLYMVAAPQLQCIILLGEQK